ncbi:universal stress protein [Fulvivirgaceae bacterium PWU4]|uniref:Universal stress protein n=1 Tax=Chryseosolibacter histidini TaxID=2782349 RepID=A0AAP2DHU2_9BACT|nr:universal stress protein [Chryseosolibacter histidini]MBT1695869.1 universal stress protein [Chryseosolibacter histidini]
MRPILCVIDLSETSVQVLEVAGRMALAYKTQLIILFPYRLIDYGYKGEISQLKNRLEGEAREKFMSLKNQVAVLGELSYDFQPEIGFPSDRISAYVRRNKVDSVVISQRQAHAMNEVNGMALQNLIVGSRLPFTIVPEQIDVESVVGIQ